MPRPRKDQEGPSAVEKIETAFWETLREKPFASITVSDIVRRAGVNRNVFYYHYENLDAMAHAVVGSALDADIPPLLVRGIESGRNPVAAFLLDELREGRLEAKFDRLWLIAGKHGSPALTRMLKDTVKRVWCEALDIDADSLSLETDTVVECLIGGIVAVIERQVEHPELPIVRDFAESDFVQRLFALAVSTLKGSAALAAPVPTACAAGRLADLQI